MPVCRTCQEEKQADAFYKDPRQKTGLHQHCSECERKAALARYHANPQRYQAKSRAWKRSNPERTAAYQRRVALKRYGISEEEYERRLLAQQGRCAICGADQPGGNGDNFHVDHDHKTGKVRGLLCCRCNRGLGYYRDSSSLLEAAVAYLKRGEM